MSTLVVIGAALLAALGIGHAVMMLGSTPTSGAFAATNPEVQRAMQARSGLGLAPKLDTTLWRAWVGFNLSHALGVVVTAGVITFHALNDGGAAMARPWFLILALGVPAVYLTLSKLYWFDKPTRGILVGSLLIWIGTVGAVLT